MGRTPADTPRWRRCALPVAIGLVMGLTGAAVPALADDTGPAEAPAPVLADGFGMPGVPVATLADDPGTRPPNCSEYFRDRNPRIREIDASPPGAHLHEMSDRCFPHGQYLGTMRDGSVFIVYYADPRYPYWWYGYSAQLDRRGYVLGSSVKVP